MIRTSSNDLVKEVYDKWPLPGDSDKVRERVRFRFGSRAGTGPAGDHAADKMAAEIGAEKVSPEPWCTVYQCEMTLDDPRLRELFLNQRPKSSIYFISWWEIIRTYTASELAACEYVHIAHRRVFPEPVRYEFDHFEFDPSCTKCQVPIRQIAPIALCGRVKSKDDLVRLSEGSVLCRPKLLQMARAAGIDVPPATPIFETVKKRAAWLETRSTSQPRGSLDPRLEPSRLTLDEMDDHEWVQIHPSHNDLDIGPGARLHMHLFWDEDKPDVLCGCEAVAGPSARTSEFHVTKVSEPTDWNLTRRFVGASRGVYLPLRELVLSARVYQALKSCRLHSSSFARAIVD